MGAVVEGSHWWVYPPRSLVLEALGSPAEGGGCSWMVEKGITGEAAWAQPASAPLFPVGPGPEGRPRPRVARPRLGLGRGLLGNSEA